jgi:hypothetical protein
MLSLWLIVLLIVGPSLVAAFAWRLTPTQRYGLLLLLAPRAIFGSCCL